LKVLVTGGSGLVGSAAARSLAELGHTVVLPLRSGQRANTVHAAIAAAAIPDIEAMSADHWTALLHGVDAVVHAAAIAHIGPSIAESQYNAVNRDASLRLAQAATRAGVARFVFISSIRAQVGSASPAVQNESSAPEPTEAYGRSKLEAEILIRQVFADAVVLRPALVVGAEARGNLDLLLKLARTGLPMPFGSFAKPQAMVSLEGLVQAITLAVTRTEFSGQTYVVADEPHPTLADMLGWMREGMGKSRRIWSVPEQLLAIPLKLIGKGDAFARLNGGLRVDASRLRETGWQSPLTPRQAFVALGRSGFGKKRLFQTA
jgi:nucleoside-diphosphate-sugar epimerase